MSLVLIDLEMESDFTDTENIRERPQGFKATAEKLEQVSLGGHCHLGLKTPKAENKDQNMDHVNGCNNAEEKTKCKKAKDAKKENAAKKTKDAQKEKAAKRAKDAKKTKDAQKEKTAKRAKDAKKERIAKKAKDAQKEKTAKRAKDAKKTKDAKKENDAKMAKDAQKTKEAKKENERDTEKVVKDTKWETLRRVVQALTLRGPATSTSPHNGDDLGCDDISFDGHLFEYASHPPVIPKVDVPRLRLRPTLRERLYNIAHNLFRCGSVKQHNQYTLD